LRFFEKSLAKNFPKNFMLAYTFSSRKLMLKPNKFFNEKTRRSVAPTSFIFIFYIELVELSSTYFRSPPHEEQCSHEPPQPLSFCFAEQAALSGQPMHFLPLFLAFTI